MAKTKKAIIIGGGISGKLAARVLSDYFKEVIILERDSKPSGPHPRKGAPQGEHLHALLHAGEYGLEKLFPGITNSFHSSGAIQINSTKDLSWYHHGVWKLQYDGGYSTTLQTRPHLEWHIEEYIKKIPNIEIYYNSAVQDYIYDSKNHQVTGVVVKANNDCTQQAADIVIDASGATSLSTNLLKRQGYVIPTHNVKIGLSYITKQFIIPDKKERNWQIKLVYPNPPKEKIGGTISRVEGNRYIVTLFGYENVIDEKEVIKNNDHFINLTKKLSKLDIYHELQEGTPITSTAVYKIPQISWRRFDKVKELPKGLLLIGDTVCRVDPVFGQGMSIAVLESLALRTLFERNSENLERISRLFPKKVANIISPIWNMVISEDFRFSNIGGKRPFGLALQQWYSKKVFHLSSNDLFVYDTFIKVMNLVSPITILFHPRIVKSILKDTIIHRIK